MESCNFVLAYCRWHRFWYLAGFNSIIPVGKMIQWCLGSIFFFFFSHHRWHSSTGMHSEWLLQPSCTILHLDSVPLKVTVPPQRKKSLLPSSIMNLFGSTYITTAFVIASKHLRFEIKICYYYILHRTVKYPKAQPLVEDACKWQCLPDMWTNLWDWTCKCMFLPLKAHNLKVHK